MISIKDYECQNYYVLIMRRGKDVDRLSVWILKKFR